MGIARHHALLFLGGLLSLAFLIFPSSFRMQSLLRDSRWSQYTQSESSRAWNQNRGDVEAAITLMQSLRAQGHLVQAMGIGQDALERHPKNAELEKALLSLYNESYDFESLARMHQSLWDQGRPAAESSDFLHSYYNERQRWGLLGGLLEAEYAKTNTKGELPWDLISFYERQRNLPKLQALFTQRLESHPRDAEALAGLIEVYQVMEEREELAELYERFLETSPNHLSTLDNLIALYEEDEIPVPEELYARRAQIRPDNINYGLAYVEALQRRGNKDLAHQELKRLAALPSPTPAQLSSMANIAAEERWDDMAMTLVLRAAQTLTPSAPWWEEAGRLALKTGDEAQARTYYEKAYTENPRQGEAARILAEMSFRSGDPEKASTYWNEWLASQPNDRAARLMIGDTLSVYNRDKAKALYDEGLAMPRKTNNAEDDFTYATLLVRRGHNKEAYAEFRALEKQGRSFTADQWADLTQLAIQVNELKPAEKYLAKAEAAAPNADRMTALRSQLYLAQNRPVEALPLLERLTQKNPQDVDIKGDLAWVYAQLGNWPQAESLYQELQNTRRQQEADRMLTEIADLHHARVEAETTARLGPASKDEWMGGLSYHASTMKGWGLYGGAREYVLTRRNASDNGKMTDAVHQLSVGGKIERRRWKMNTELDGYFGQKADDVSPKGQLAYQTSQSLLALSGTWNQTLLDPSEALDARGRQDLVRVDASKRWKQWEARVAGSHRGLHMDGSRNTINGENGLGSEKSAEFGLVRILSEKQPYATLGYTFVSSHWNKSFDQAGTFIPWLDNQRSHQGTLYVEKRTSQKLWDTVSASASGGRDFARDIWLMNVAADVSGRFWEFWRWSAGAGWAKDSGVVGSGSSTSLRAKIIRLFE